MKQIYKQLGKVRPTVEGDWSIDKTYTLLSIVYDEVGNASYISRKDVPAGIQITNKEYWTRFSNTKVNSDSIVLLSKIQDDGLINSYDLQEAIDSFKVEDRRLGTFISFYEKPIGESTDYRWNLYQFNSNNIDDWNNTKYWQSIYYIQNKFLGLFSSEESLKRTRPFPIIGDYAFVGATLKEAVVYRCNNIGVWTRTNEKAKDYLSINLKGDITISEEGNWIIDGVDTGISSKGEDGKTPLLRIKDYKWQVSYDGGTIYKDIPNSPIFVKEDDEDIVGDLQTDGVKLLKFADKEYNVDKFSGLGRVYLRKNIVNGKNVLTQEMINKYNTIYIIQYDYDLDNKQINILENCILQFEGGSFINGSLNGNNTDINANTLIFKNISVIGTWKCIGEARWFAKSSPYTISTLNNLNINKIDVTNELQLLLDSSFYSIYINKGFYYITRTLILSKNKEIKLEGKHSNNYLLQRTVDCIDKTFIFSDKNITLLRIAIDEFYIQTSVKVDGGNFDVSLYSNIAVYTNNCIEIDIRNKRSYWGIYINTSIYGTYAAKKPSSGTAIKFIDDKTGGYATMINFNCIIKWFDLAYDIRAISPSWITNVNLNGECSNCNKILNTTADAISNIDVQTHAVFTKDNIIDYPLFVSSSLLVISGMLWDLSNLEDGKITNYYIAEVKSNRYKNGVIFTGKILFFKEIYNDRIIGDIYNHNIYNFGDKYNYIQNYLFNTLEGYNYKEETPYTYKLLNNTTASVNIKNKDDMFLNKRGTTFNIINEDSENIDLEITFNFKQSRIANFTLIYNNNIGNDKIFEACNIRFIYDNPAYKIKEINYVEQIDKYQRFKNIDLKSDIFDIVKNVIVTFKNIKHDITIIKVISNNFQSSYLDYIPSFLPISGGTIYGKTDFKNLYLDEYNISLKNNKILINKSNDALGNPANALKKGTTAQRPTGVQIGFTYKDTDLNKWIIWNGEAWENVDGTALG